MKVLLTDGDRELGRVVQRSLRARGHGLAGPGAPADVAIILEPQRANTLLHDGHAWRGQALRLPELLQSGIHTARLAGASHIVLASCGYVGAPPDHPDFLAAADAEAAVERAGMTTTILRLGWRYGPTTKDLTLYRRSFRLFRPYYAGPSDRRQSFLHNDDAAAALVAAAEHRPRATLAVADSAPVSFAQFIDAFARHLRRRRRPGHLPRWTLPLLMGQIDNRQIAILDRETVLDASEAGPTLDWKPSFPDHNRGLADIVRVWATPTH